VKELTKAGKMKNYLVIGGIVVALGILYLIVKAQAAKQQAAEQAALANTNFNTGSPNANAVLDGLGAAGVFNDLGTIFSNWNPPNNEPGLTGTIAYSNDPGLNDFTD
jgi:hypothetical protein